MMKCKKQIGISILLCVVLVSIFGNNVTLGATKTMGLNKKEVSLRVGENYQLIVNNLPNNAKVTWSSSSKSKATVSNKGVVNGKKTGTVTIKAKVAYKSGLNKRTKTFSSKVKVKKSKTSQDKTLVVYFSAPVAKRDNQVDGISSASRVIEGETYEGNTEYMANIIKEQTGADVFEIIPSKAYPTTYDKMVTQAETEQESDARPEIKNKIKNISQYDTIYVGYPIWWSEMPQILYTFFDTYDLNGKNIIPFCTHAGSGMSGTTSEIKKLEPGATVYEGLAMYRTDVKNSENEIKTWITTAKKS